MLEGENLIIWSVVNVVVVSWCVLFANLVYSANKKKFFDKALPTELLMQLFLLASGLFFTWFLIAGAILVWA